MCKFCIRDDLGGEFTRREVLMTMAGAGMAAGLMGSGVLTAAPRPGPRHHLPIRSTYASCTSDPRASIGWDGPERSGTRDGFAAKSRRHVEQFAAELGIQPAFESAPLHEKAEIEAFVKKVQAEKPKGVLVFPLHADEFISGAVDKITQSGIPTIVFAGLGMWHTGFAAMVVPTSRRKGVYMPSSGDYELGPVRFGMKMIQTHYRLQHTKIAVLRGNETAEYRAAPLGLTLRFLPPAAFSRYAQDDPGNARGHRHGGAAGQERAKVVEPTRQDLINAAENYFASLKIMEEEGCQGITMDCLGLVRTTRFPRRPASLGPRCSSTAGAALARRTSTP